MNLPKGARVEQVALRPDEVKKQALKEGAIMYDNEFEHFFEPWPRDKIKKNMKKLTDNINPETDEELKEFVKLHPTIAKMAKASSDKTKSALVELFAAHDDILSGKATKEEVMAKLMRGVLTNAVSGDLSDSSNAKACHVDVEVGQ